MRIAICWLLLAVVSLGSLGCGQSGATVESMKRRAIRRDSSEDEEEEKRPDAATDAQQATASPAASPAADKNGSPNPAPNAGNVPVAASPNRDQPAAGPASPSANNNTASGAAPSGLPGNAPDSAPGTTAALPASTTRHPPETPLSESERQVLSMQHLDAIGAALQQFIATHRRLPAAAIYDSSRTAGLLSWRVELLPFLGLNELYKHFHLDEPWDSTHNLRLLPLIPEVYQSPERFDDRTNYLATVGSSAAFQGTRNVYLSKFEDGPANTAAVVEVDDDRAVPWTKPSEYEVILPSPAFGLGGLRKDGFLVLSAAGRASWIRLPIASERLRSIYTVDAGESEGLVSLAASSQAAADADNASRPPAAPSPADIAGTAAAAEPGATQPTAGLPATGTPTAGTSTVGASSPDRFSSGLLQPQPEKVPLPDLLAQRKARNLYREIYGEEYAKATQPSEKQRFARKLLEMVPQVREHPASLYVLLDIARDVAAQGDDLESAVEALEQMCNTFDLDTHDLQRKTLAVFVHKGKDQKSAHGRKIMQRALAYSDQALRDEAFNDAEELCNLALGAIAGQKDDGLLKQVTRQRDIAKDFKQAARDSQDALATLEESPGDGPANLALGRYLCFFQGDWENGLPILAQGSSGGLLQAVQLELSAPSEPAQQADLGEMWWDRGESASAAEQRAMRQRAVLWFERALPGLPGGLRKIKLQKRIELFGAEEQQRQALLSQKS